VIVDEKLPELVDRAKEVVDQIPGKIDQVKEKVNEVSDFYDALKSEENTHQLIDEISNSLEKHHVAGWCMGCIAKHCLPQVTNCLKDTECRGRFKCEKACGHDDDKCIRNCEQTYRGDAMADLMYCMHEKRPCVKLPDIDVVCRSVPTVEVNPSDLSGTWH